MGIFKLNNELTNIQQMIFYMEAKKIPFYDTRPTLFGWSVAILRLV